MSTGQSGQPGLCKLQFPHRSLKDTKDSIAVEGPTELSGCKISMVKSTQPLNSMVGQEVVTVF